MLNSARVQVHGHVFRRFLKIEDFILILRIRVSEEIPRRVNEGVHCIGFSFRRTATRGTSGVHKRFNGGQRIAFAKMLSSHGWKQNRQIFIWNSYWTTRVAMNDRYWCTPVSLSADQPISNLELNGFATAIVGFQNGNNFFGCVFAG